MSSVYSLFFQCAPPVCWCQLMKTMISPTQKTSLTCSAWTVWTCPYQVVTMTTASHVLTTGCQQCSRLNLLDLQWSQGQRSTQKPLWLKRCKPSCIPTLRLSLLPWIQLQGWMDLRTNNLTLGLFRPYKNICSSSDYFIVLNRMSFIFKNCQMNNKSIPEKTVPFCKCENWMFWCCIDTGICKMLYCWNEKVL